MNGRNKLVGYLANLLASFHVGAERAIENEEREKSRLHQFGASEVESSEKRIFALFSVLYVEEPDASVNSEAVATSTITIRDEPVLNRDVG